MTRDHYKEFESFAIELALNAGKLIVQFKKKAKIIQQKTNILDFATEADLASENLIRNEIAKKYPLHGIVGEEQGVTLSEAEYIWIVDPLDGTLDYTRGFLSFDVFIALEHYNNLIAGCIYRPMTDTLFSSARGFGAKKNNQKINVSEVKSLEESIIYYSLPRHNTPADEAKRVLGVLQRLSKESGLIRDAWEGGMSLANVAAGSAEACLFKKTGPKWWDVAAGILLVEEAGGKVTDLSGKSIRNRNLSHGIVASNGLVHDDLLAIINN